MNAKMKKIISLIICVCMLIPCLAIASFAAGETTYTVIDTVAELTSGYYYMGGVVTHDGYGPYQIFTGSVGTSSGKTDLQTSKYTFEDGVLATDASYTAVTVKVTEVADDTYTLFVEGKGYITCTDTTASRRLNFADEACEWVVSNNPNGGITFATTVDGSTAYMGINQSSASSPTTSKFIRSYTSESTLTYGLVFFAEGTADVEGDDESYKETFTYVDGVNVGIIQQLGAEWDEKPASDFWYQVNDFEDEIYIFVIVDDREVLPGVLKEDNNTALASGTKLRVWIDADPADTTRTTLIDVAFIDGEAKVIRVDSNMADAIVDVEYDEEGNDYGFALVLDKAVLGIDGEFGMVVSLEETGRTTMHDIKYDNVTGSGNTFAPWSTTEFYKIYGSKESEQKDTLTIEEAIALGQTMEHNTYTEGKYYVTGVVESVYNTQYGNMYIVDEDGNRLTIYGTYSADGSLRYDAMEVAPQKGDTVTIYGVVGQYSGTSQIKNGWVVDIVPGEGEDDEEVVPDPEADSVLSVKDAIALGASKDHNCYTEGKYYVTGVITEIYNDVYGNMKITDADGNILTVYGTYSADGEVRFDSMETKPVVGDTVKVYGILGQYNDVAQMKNGWIIEINPEVEDDGETPEMGSVGIYAIAGLALVALIGTAVVIKKRA